MGSSCISARAEATSLITLSRTGPKLQHHGRRRPAPPCSETRPPKVRACLALHSVGEVISKA